MNVHVPSPITAGLITISFQPNRTLIILIYHVLINVTPLKFDELFGTHNLGSSIINPNYTGLCGSLWFNALLFLHTSHNFFPK